jgi:hypothetical protein
LTNFVLNRCDGLALEPHVVAVELVRPEKAHQRVLNVTQDPSSIRRIDQHSHHAEERGVLAVEQCRQAVVENVFQPRPPRVAPDTLECANDT